MSTSYAPSGQAEHGARKLGYKIHSGEAAIMPDLGDADDSWLAALTESGTPGSLRASSAPPGQSVEAGRIARSPPPGDAASWAARHGAGVTDPVLPFNFAGRCRIVL